jgi:uncharacterized membrane protein (DUF106 family)
MEWISKILPKEPTVLIISISIVIGVFIVAARKAYLDHIEKLKKIDDTFNIK